MPRWIALLEEEQILFADFRVNASPVPQPRPRATSICGHASVYAAPKRHKIHEFRSKVEHAARKMMGDREALTVPVAVSMSFYCTPPKAMSKVQLGEQRGIMATGGDVDNFAKGVLDAMTSARVWVDDSRVCALGVSKMFTPGREHPPCVMIKVYVVGKEKEKKEGESDEQHEQSPIEDEKRSEVDAGDSIPSGAGV